jgi:putative tryptophan/tyrosine transport system substrate-binding protein
MNNRRMLLAGIVAAGLARPFELLAEQRGKLWRVGFFYFGSDRSAHNTGRYWQFQQGMRELGYEEGKNLVIEARFADGKADRLSAIVAEFTRLNVDVIVATGGPVYYALRDAGVNIPVAVTVASDPVGTGLAKSLARPGGIFTGLSENNVELVTKHLELLRIAVPNLARVGVLTNPTNPIGSAAQLKSVQAVARPLGIHVLREECSAIEGIAPAFTAISNARAQALIICNDTFFVQESRYIAELAVNRRIASIFGTQDYARAGGLMSYGPEVVDNFRRVAGYVDKILNGAKPGDIPWEQSTKFELVLNLKAARELGLRVPQSVLISADEVIE